MKRPVRAWTDTMERVPRSVCHDSEGIKDDFRMLGHVE